MRSRLAALWNLHMNRSKTFWIVVSCVAALGWLSAHPVYSQEGGSSQSATTAITAVWANDGEDKVTQDELRASSGQNVTNSLWN